MDSPDTAPSSPPEVSTGSAGSPVSSPDDKSIRELDRRTRLRKGQVRDAVARLRARKAEKEKLLQEASEKEDRETCSPAPTPSDSAKEDQRSDEEISRDTGMLFACLWPIFRVAARLAHGTLDPLTDEDRERLGSAFLPIVRRSTVLLWTTRWVSGPATLVDVIRKRFRRVKEEFSAPKPAEKSDSPAGAMADPKPQSSIVSPVLLLKR